ncbi:Cinnamoyl-CoA reductase-like SNL6 [Vitis vinifera]|uniref:Cinnamoyl-CoA reductase-like SNL6 n=1 Tax=Vitis vinifera TaxID=29760 RepID=A0A438EFZ3_VITVI|nr:Cinnamoyl-CoA reductase-like SNL6 [Vitis vinifera]
MGFVRNDEIHRQELEDFRRMLLASAGAYKVNAHEHRGEEGTRAGKAKIGTAQDDEEEKLVCVTSGVSFLGLALVNRLLSRGYSVRVIVDSEGDVEKVEEMRRNNSNIWPVTAKLSEVESLEAAMEGCRGVFHTSGFVDPAGLTGYSKAMAGIEVKASENVMEACARTPSVKGCVLTSSLLACVWQGGSNADPSPIVDHDSWSDEAFCLDRKLWYAWGKLKAEKAAWRVAEEKGLRLSTICPALVTGPEFYRRNPTATLAYLKGAYEMYGSGLLATVDVTRLAEAHVVVFEAMSKASFGRYICFDSVVGGEAEAENLAAETGMPLNRITGDGSSSFSTRFELSDGRLSGLMSRTSCYSESQE